MIRRDYILNAIEEFAAVLAKMLGFARDADWQGVSTVSVEEFQKLIGMDAPQALGMSHTQLLARLVETAPTQLAEVRLYMLATLFKAQADALTTQGRSQEGRQYCLKGLHLLLDATDQTAIGERPDFVPTIDAFLSNLGEDPLPVETNVLLMRHYERMGDFGRAEDALFSILDASTPDGDLLGFGEAFYERIAKQSDDALQTGNLPRAEAQTGLAEFRGKAQPR